MTSMVRAVPAMSISRTRTVCRFNLGMAVKQLADLRQHEAHMIRLCFRGEAQRRLEQNLVAAAEILQIDGRHDTVRNRNECAFVRSDARRAQSDIFDNAGAIAEAANVSDTEDFVPEYRYAAEKILDRLLRAEADGKAADAKPGQRRAHVESQIAEYCKYAQDENDEFNDALAQQHERSGASKSVQTVRACARGSNDHRVAATPARSC